MSMETGIIPLRQRAPLRFVHASDLHLDRTMEGVAEGPSSWEQRYLNVSQRGAERLFQRVLDENVDFLVLSGDVLNAGLAPPGLLLFLINQFERLRKAGIPVYWAGGEFDSPEDWPVAFPLPDNVHLFPSGSIQEYYYQRPGNTTGQPIAKIVGMSRNQPRRTIRNADFPIDPGSVFTIAVANGDIDSESIANRRIDYWALGGSSKRQVFRGNPRKIGADGKPVPLEFEDPTIIARRDLKDLPLRPYIVHYPGTPVARTPKDLGICGATLVEITWGNDPVLTQLATSPVRWVNDQIVLTNDDDAGKLADELRSRIKNYRAQQKGDDLFINWYVDAPPGLLAANLRRGNLTVDLLSELRALYGKEEPLTWSASLTVLLPDQLPPSFYEQQTILGDFLRSVQHFQSNPRELIDLESYLPKEDVLGEETYKEMSEELLLATKIKVESETTAVQDPLSPEAVVAKKKYRLTQSPEQAEIQRRVLREATVLGLELLGAENPKLFTPGTRLGPKDDSEDDEK